MESIRSQQAEAQARLKSTTTANNSSSGINATINNQNNKTLQLSLKPNLTKYYLPSPAKTAGKKSTVASSVVSADASTLSKQKKEKGNTIHTIYHSNIMHYIY